MSNEKSQVEVLKEKLFYDRKNAAKACSADEVAAADAFCEGYKAFLNAAKTEREFTRSDGVYRAKSTKPRLCAL